MKATYLIRCMFILLCLGFTACQEDDTPTEGPQGEQGPPGADGQDGNANVISSDWIPQQFSNSATSHTSFDIVDPNITQSVIDTGLVLAFGKIGESSISIPFVYQNRSYYISLFDEGKIRFLGAAVNGGNENFFDISHVRYVIIPASTTGKKADVDFTSMSYEEVMDYFNLEH